MDCNDYSCSGQMDIFDFLEDKNKVKEFNPLKALALCGTGFENGIKRVKDYFLENHNLREKVAFLKNEYGTGGFGSPEKKPCYIHGMCTATSQKLIEYEYYDEDMQDISCENFDKYAREVAISENENTFSAGLIRAVEIIRECESDGNG